MKASKPDLVCLDYQHQSLQTEMTIVKTGRDFSGNTFETMYDNGQQQQQFELERLRDTVNFWKDKVDQLLKEKSEQLLDKMNAHKQIREYEFQVDSLKAMQKEKDKIIESLQLTLAQ